MPIPLKSAAWHRSDFAHRAMPSAKDAARRLPEEETQ
jgi:hypothetical protein